MVKIPLRGQIGLAATVMLTLLTSGHAMAAPQVPTATACSGTEAGGPQADADVKIQTKSGPKQIHFCLHHISSQRPDGCYRKYKLAMWRADPSGNPEVSAPFDRHFHIQVWMCGQRRPDLDLDERTNPDTFQGDYKESREVNYGNCGPQADDVGTDASNPDWTPQHIYAYVHLP
jgi:hypothetical protein